jgi:dCMP deaminase
MSQATQRNDWDHYFMEISKVAATRATCERKHVGAVLVKDRTILSTGYNGSPKGMDHCDDVGHMMEHGHCVRTAHAEANAIIQAAKNGTSIEGATIYTTASPCWPCMKLIINAGIKRIVFGEMYRDTRVGEFAFNAGIELVNLSGDYRPTGTPLQVAASLAEAIADQVCVVPGCGKKFSGSSSKTCVSHMGCCHVCGKLPDERHDHP